MSVGYLGKSALCRCSRWNGPYSRVLNARITITTNASTPRPLLFTSTHRKLTTEVSTDSTPLRKQNILFMGTDDFAMRVLSGLHSDLLTNASSPIAHIEVVCPPDRPFGRQKILKGAAVKTYAVQHGLPVHLIPAKGIKHWTVPKVKCGTSEGEPEMPFDMGVVVSFGYFIPGRIIDALHLVNIHPSLLPRHRGASPIQYTILSGDSEAGVSLIELSKESFDSGNVIAQVQCPVEDTDTFQSLINRMVPLSADMLLSTIASLANGLHIQSQPQSTFGREITLAPKVDNTTSRIDWSTYTCAAIDRIQRALAHKTALYSTWNGKEIKLLDIVPPQLDQNPVQTLGSQPPQQESYSQADELTLDLHLGKKSEISPAPGGTPRYDVDTQILYIRCVDGWVGFRTVQSATKKLTSSSAFANGYKLRATGYSPENMRFV